MSRPSVVILSVFALIVGGLIMGAGFHLILIGSIVVALHSAAGNIVNDYFDYETDKINKPKRPIPSGRVTKRQAKNVSGTIFVLATLLAATINIYTFVLSLFNIFVNYIYSSEMKKKALIGNFGPSWLAASVFIFASLMAGSLTQLMIVIASLAFLANVGREIIKDIEDMKGDEAVGAVTLPMIASKKVAVGVAALFILLAISFSPLPYILGLSKYYVYMIIIGNFLFLYSLSRIRNPSKAHTTMKLAMFVVIISFLAGTF